MFQNKVMYNPKVIEQELDCPIPYFKEKTIENLEVFRIVLLERLDFLQTILIGLDDNVIRPFSKKT